MDELNTIKSKLQLFFNEAKSLNSSDEAIEKFKEIFKDNYFEENISEESPYYKSYSQELYIKNGCGIGITKVSGPGDFMTLDNPSHYGTDVYIFSKLANKSIMLFEESKKRNIETDIDDFFKINFSTKNLLDIRDDIVFKFIPDAIKNKDEIIKGRYEKLKIRAEIEHENDIEDDLISYYGGLDVTIHSTPYYLYESLLKNIEDTYFMKKVMPLFLKDFPTYIDKQIDICEHALYMIENKEKYYEWVKLDEDIFFCNSSSNDIWEFKEDKNKEKEEIQLKLNEILDKCKTIKEEKYNIFDLIKGKRKDDRIKINNINTQIDTLKKDLMIVEEKLSEADIKYEELEKEEENCKKQKQELSLTLEREFEDFTLNPDFDDWPYIGSKYYLEVSLDRLIDNENECRERLTQLQQMKSFFSKDLDEKEINQEKNLDYEC